MAGLREQAPTVRRPYQKDNRSDIYMIRGRPIVFRGLETGIFLEEGAR